MPRKGTQRDSGKYQGHSRTKTHTGSGRAQSRNDALPSTRTYLAQEDPSSGLGQEQRFGKVSRKQYRKTSRAEFSKQKERIMGAGRPYTSQYNPISNYKLSLLNTQPTQNQHTQKSSKKNRQILILNKSQKSKKFRSTKGE